MTDYAVHIEFLGVCAHFWGNILGDIPHRVVLPDASNIRCGFVTSPEKPDPDEWQKYVLAPHYPGIELKDDTEYFVSPGVVTAGGLLFTTSRIMVANAIGFGVTYDNDPPPGIDGERIAFDSVPSLKDFVEHYQYSNDVVRSGRASAYVDIFSGRVGAYVDSTKSKRVYAHIPTDGPPVVTITPMEAQEQLQPVVRTYEGGEVMRVVVTNDCNIGGAHDFMLHLLTHSSGLPRVVTHPLPGVSGDPISPVTLEAAAAAMQAYPNLAPTFQGTHQTVVSSAAGEISARMPRWNVSDGPTCSDSRYP